MPTYLPLRSVVAPAILLTALLAGCRDDPTPAPDARASKVAAKQDKPVEEKPTPSSGVPARPSPSSEVKPALALPSAIPSASAAPSASVATAAPEVPVAPVDPSLDCDKLLAVEDVFVACNIKVEVPDDQPKENIGSEPRCVRRFNSKDAGLLTVIVLRYANNTEAKDRYDQDFKVDLSKPEPIEGVGDVSRYFVKTGVGGSPILTAEAVKDRFKVTVFNPKITVGGQTIGPVCDQKGLGKVLAKVLTHIF
jgi:hypothetical protein